jgi:hypothetical protein
MKAILWSAILLAVALQMVEMTRQLHHPSPGLGNPDIVLGESEWGTYFNLVDGDENCSVAKKSDGTLAKGGNLSWAECFALVVRKQARGSHYEEWYDQKYGKCGPSSPRHALRRL